LLTRDQVTLESRRLVKPGKRPPGSKASAPAGCGSMTARGEFLEQAIAGRGLSGAGEHGLLVNNGLTAETTGRSFCLLLKSGRFFGIHWPHAQETALRCQEFIRCWR
jgi:hypothetical protein